MNLLLLGLFVITFQVVTLQAMYHQEVTNAL